jgi:hypothetical protein
MLLKAHFEQPKCYFERAGIQSFLRLLFAQVLFDPLAKMVHYLDTLTNILLVWPRLIKLPGTSGAAFPGHLTRLSNQNSKDPHQTSHQLLTSQWKIKIFMTILFDVYFHSEKGFCTHKSL